MSQPPISRTHPHLPGLSARLVHGDRWPALSITDSPQTIELEFTNRTPLPLVAGPATMRLVFRRGTLTDLGGMVLAPQSEADWVLSVDESTDEAAQNVTLLLAGVHKFALAPGASRTVRLDGVSAAEPGGSRATRVEFHYEGLFLPAGEEVMGSRLIHLPILRRHQPRAVRPIDLRTGSAVFHGPFAAGFLSEPVLINDGKTANLRTLRIVNVTDWPLRLSGDGDQATRLQLSFRAGNDAAPWGLLKARGDRLQVSIDAEGWQTDHHSIRRLRDGVLRPGEYLELRLDIHTSAPSGQARLVVTYENLPGQDDGDLVFLLGLRSSAEISDATHFVRPVELWGNGASIRFHPSEEGVDDATSEAAPSVMVNRTNGREGQLEIAAPKGVQVTGPDDKPIASIDQAGNLSVSGSITDKDGPVVPIGTIVMWSNYGKSGLLQIPEGWALCDGQDGRPDLRGRFVVGYAPDGRPNKESPQQDNKDFSSLGDFGGESLHRLSAAELPAHSHNGRIDPAGGHYHHVPVYMDGSRKNGGAYGPGNSYMFHFGPEVSNIFSATKIFETRTTNGRIADYGPTTNLHNAHAHEVTIGYTGNGQAHENRPPYYTLAYIIKVA